MTTRLYQMYDLTAQATSGPIISEKRDGPAIRAFSAVLANKETLPGQYPDQFELRLVGIQDEETGQIDAGIPYTVATGRQWNETQLAPETRLETTH